MAFSSLSAVRPDYPTGSNPTVETLKIVGVSEDGRMITLSDGVIWQADGWRIMHSCRWRPGDLIEVHYTREYGQAPAILCHLSRMKGSQREKFFRNEWVPVHLASSGFIPFDPSIGYNEMGDQYGQTIVALHEDGMLIELDDGTLWRAKFIHAPLEVGPDLHWTCSQVELLNDNPKEYVKAWGVGTVVRLRYNPSSHIWPSRDLTALGKSWQTWHVNVQFAGFNPTEKSLYIQSISDKGKQIELTDGTVWRADGWHSNLYGWQPGDIIIYGFQRSWAGCLNRPHADMLITPFRRLDGEGLGADVRHQWELVTPVS